MVRIDSSSVSGPAAGRDQPAAGPRYLQVAAELRAAIAAGVFVEGAALPTESALCERFAVSRFTVREALRRLQADGLIRRRRGSGTVVDTGGTIRRQPLSDVAELLQYAAGSEFAFTVTGPVRMPAALAAEIGIAAGTPWVHLSGLRTVAGAAGPIAVAVTDVYIHGDLAAHVPALRPGRETLFEQLAGAAGFRIGRVQQDICAVAAGNREARGLGIARRAPVLRITRSYRDTGGRIVEISVSSHPGERFTYSMHIDQG